MSNLQRSNNHNLECDEAVTRTHGGKRLSESWDHKPLYGKKLNLASRGTGLTLITPTNITMFGVLINRKTATQLMQF